MQFKAETPDLVLELVLLDGSEVTLEPKDLMSGRQAINIIKQWTALEKTISKNGTTGIDIMASQLALVYDKKESWWLENLDTPTIAEILTHVGQVIGGVKKKKSN